MTNFAAPSSGFKTASAVASAVNALRIASPIVRLTAHPTVPPIAVLNAEPIVDLIAVLNAVLNAEPIVDLIAVLMADAAAMVVDTADIGADAHNLDATHQQPGLDLPSHSHNRSRRNKRLRSSRRHNHHHHHLRRLWNRGSRHLPIVLMQAAPPLLRLPPEPEFQNVSNTVPSPVK